MSWNETPIRFCWFRHFWIRLNYLLQAVSFTKFPIPDLLSRASLFLIGKNLDWCAFLIFSHFCFPFGIVTGTSVTVQIIQNCLWISFSGVELISRKSSNLSQEGAKTLEGAKNIHDIKILEKKRKLVTKGAKLLTYWRS